MGAPTEPACLGAHGGGRTRRAAGARARASRAQPDDEWCFLPLQWVTLVARADGAAGVRLRLEEGAGAASSMDGPSTWDLHGGAAGSHADRRFLS